MTEQNAERITYQEQLRVIREQSGLPLPRFAAKIGIHRQLLVTLESGDKKPTSYPAFYDALRLNGVSEEMVQKLLDSEGAPEKLLTDEEASQPLVILEAGGRKISIFADRDQFKPEDFDPKEVFKLANHLRSIARRDKTN